MTELFDRRHDAFDKPAKMACREGNLRVLREVVFLFWHNVNQILARCD